jgi:hypothetical protein
MVLFGVLLFLIPLLLACFLAFDRLVCFEYGSHRSRWESDGRPRGFFWAPAEGGGLRSYLAQQRLSFTWLFSTPHWMRADRTALRLVWRLRLLVLAWHIAIISAAVVVYLWVIP